MLGIKSMAVAAVMAALVGVLAGGCNGAPSAQAKAPAVQESAERAFAREFYRADLLHQDPGNAWDMMAATYREYEYRDLIRRFGDRAREEYVAQQAKLFKRWEMPADLDIKEWHPKQTQAWTFLFETSELPYDPYVIVVVRDEKGIMAVTDAHFYKPGEKLP